MNEWLKLGTLFLITCLVYLLEIKANNNFWGGGGIALALIFSLYIVAFTGPRTQGHNLLFPLRFIGKYCYGVYVYSAFIGAFIKQVHGIQPGFLYFFISLLGVPVAVISYHVFEKHFFIFKRRVA